MSLLVGTFASVLMSSACDPLAPLQRWITYTQCEVLQIKRELHEYRQEVSASHKIQQQQLDTVQSQLRESEQRITELIEAVAELFQKQNRTQDLFGKLLADLASLRVHVKLQKRVRKRFQQLSHIMDASPLATTPSLGEGVCV